MIERFRHYATQRPDVILAIVLAIGALICIAILQLASEIAEGEIGALDVAVLVWTRGTLGESAALHDVMLDLTALGDTTTLAMVVIGSAAFLIAVRMAGMALFLTVECVVAALAVHLLKFLFDRSRPDVVTHWAPFSGNSFPSGHSANSAVIYISLAVLIAGVAPTRAARFVVGGSATILCIGVGLSRLYLGVHWPTDVLAGWAMGGVWALLIWTIAWRFGFTRQRSDPIPPVTAGHLG